jgi:hypothetical protein
MITIFFPENLILLKIERICLEFSIEVFFFFPCTMYTAHEKWSSYILNGVVWTCSWIEPFFMFLIFKVRNSLFPRLEQFLYAKYNQKLNILTGFNPRTRKLRISKHLYRLSGWKITKEGHQRTNHQKINKLRNTPLKRFCNWLHADKI